MHKLKDIQARLLASPDNKSPSLIRMHAKWPRAAEAPKRLAINVQTAVDDRHHLIIAYEVTNVGDDRAQLSNMPNQARAEIGAESLTGVADRGCYKGVEILACERGPQGAFHSTGFRGAK
jgi:hypothetical protein